MSDAPIPATHIPRAGTHVAALDGVRGLAVLLVLFYHATRETSDNTFGQFWTFVVREYAWTGVDLFFVLSGFLITGILIDTRSSSGYFSNFYARRALRILPLYYGYLIAIFLIAPHIDSRIRAVERVGNEQIWYWCYLQNFAIGQYTEWPHSQFVNHLWSLAIEEQFYLVWPLVVWMVSPRRLGQCCLLVAFSSALVRLVAVCAESRGWVTPLGVYVATPTRLDGLAIGGAIAVLARSPNKLAQLEQWSLPAMLISVSVCAAVTYIQPGFHYLQPLTAAIGFPAIVVLFATVLVRAVVASHDSSFARLLSVRPLRILGKYSYGLYVWHQLAFAAATHVVLRADSLVGLLGPQIVFYLVGMPLAMGLALASWHLYECWFLRLKQFFEYQSTAISSS